MSTWTTAFPQTVQTITANAQTIGPFDVTPYSNVMVIASGAAHAGITLAFEVSLDGTTWTAIGGAKVDNAGQTNGSSNLATNSTTGFDFAVGSATSFRIRSTAYSSGTLSVVVSLGNAAYEPSVIASWSNDPGLQLGHPADNNSNIPANQSNLFVTSQNQQYNGSSWDRVRVPIKFIDIPAVAITAGTPATVWTPAAGKKFRLMGWALDSSVASRIIFMDQAATLFRTGTIPVGTTQVSPPRVGNGVLSGVANNVLKLDVGSSSTVGGFVFGTEE